MQSVVLFWVAASDDELGTVRDHPLGAGIRVVRCGMRELVAQATEARGCGPVIAVVDDDRTAAEALGAGVDEIVRHSELTSEDIQRAVTRAAARAQRRLCTPVVPDRLANDEADALSVLLDWIAIELAGCVTGAKLDSDLLGEQLPKLVASSREDGCSPPARGIPLLSSADDLTSMVTTLRGFFRQTIEVLNALRELRRPSAPTTSVPHVIGALVRVLRSSAIPLADIRVEADDPCITTMSTATLVPMLVVLVSSALARARQASGRRARITLRAFMARGSTVLEIKDDVAGHEGAGPRSDAITARIGASLRGLGGGLVVNAGSDGTTLRLLLPVAKRPSGASS